MPPLPDGVKIDIITRLFTHAQAYGVYSHFRTAASLLALIGRVVADDGRPLLISTRDRYLQLLRKDPTMYQEVFCFLSNSYAICECGHAVRNHDGKDCLGACRGPAISWDADKGDWDYSAVCAKGCTAFKQKPLPPPG